MLESLTEVKKLRNFCLLYPQSNEFCLFFCMVTEIAKVRASLFQISGVKKEPLILPEPEGDVTTLTEKVYVPVKEHPDVSIYCGYKFIHSFIH